MSETCDNNTELQAAELTALSSIYGNDMSVFDPFFGSFSITIRSSIDSPDTLVLLRVTLPPQYPSNSPPMFELNAPWLRGESRRNLESDLISVSQENAGCPVVYSWVETIRQYLDAVAPSLSGENQSSDLNKSNLAHSVIVPGVAQEVTDKFLHGEPIVDRRSIFQAHLLAPIDSLDAVKQGLASLIASDRKIASATHNIWAYRIERPTSSSASSATAITTGGSFLTDCDDDGESQAGGRLLRLLELTGARNVLVVVSRWYGGILLGPDRFRHINNAARRLLEAQGHIAGAVSKQPR